MWSKVWQKYWFLISAFFFSCFLVGASLHWHSFMGDARWFDGLFQTYQLNGWGYFSRPDQDLAMFNGHGRVFSQAYPNSTIWLYSAIFGFNFWWVRWPLSFITPILTTYGFYKVLQVYSQKTGVTYPKNYLGWGALLMTFSSMFVGNVVVDGSISKILGLNFIPWILYFYLKVLNQSLINSLKQHYWSWIGLILTSLALMGCQFLQIALVGVVMALLAIMIFYRDWRTWLLAGALILGLFILVDGPSYLLAMQLQKPDLSIIRATNPNLDISNNITAWSSLTYKIFSYFAIFWWVPALFVVLSDLKIQGQKRLLQVVVIGTLLFLWSPLRLLIAPFLQNELLDLRLMQVMIIPMVLAGFVIGFKKWRFSVIQWATIIQLALMVVAVSVKIATPVPLPYSNSQAVRNQIWTKFPEDVASVSLDYLPKGVSYQTEARVEQNQVYDLSHQKWVADKIALKVLNPRQVNLMVSNLDAGTYVLPFYMYFSNYVDFKRAGGQVKLQNIDGHIEITQKKGYQSLLVLEVHQKVSRGQVQITIPERIGVK